MKKHLIILSLTNVFLLLGCTGITQSDYSDSEIINLAKEYYWQDPQSEIQSRFRAFENLNRRMPANLKEIENTTKWIAKQNGIKKWNRLRILGKPGPHSYKQLLRDKNSYLISFKDSCFFFNSRWKIGCILYESHCTMVNIDPWNYAFRVDFLDNKGYNMGEWDKGNTFLAEIEAISHDYPYKYKCHPKLDKLKEYHTAFSPVFINGERLHENTVYRQIISFTKNAPYQFVCESQIDSLWAENEKGEKMVIMPNNPEYACQDFFQRLNNLAQKYFSQNPDCQSILCPVPFVF